MSKAWCGTIQCIYISTGSEIINSRGQALSVQIAKPVEVQVLQGERREGGGEERGREEGGREGGGREEGRREGGGREGRREKWRRN